MDGQDYNMRLSYFPSNMRGSRSVVQGFKVKFFQIIFKFYIFNIFLLRVIRAIILLVLT
jgi:hypothetical protein